MNEPYLTAREIAELLGVTPKWVLEKWEAFDRGDPNGLPGFRLGPPPAPGRRGGPVRFRQSEVEAWLRDQQRDSLQDVRLFTPGREPRRRAIDLRPSR